MLRLAVLSTVIQCCPPPTLNAIAMALLHLSHRPQALLQHVTTPRLFFSPPPNYNHPPRVPELHPGFILPAVRYSPRALPGPASQRDTPVVNTLSNMKPSARDQLHDLSTRGTPRVPGLYQHEHLHSLTATTIFPFARFVLSLSNAFGASSILTT